MNVSALSSVSTAVPAQFNAAAARNASPAAQRSAVATQFEAILVRQLLGSTVTSMLGGAQAGAAGSVYGDMLADTISQQLSAGRGLGLGRFIEEQLTPRTAPAAPRNDLSTSGTPAKDAPASPTTP